MNEIRGISIIGYGLGEPGGHSFTVSDRTTAQPLEPSFHSATFSDLDRAAEMAEGAFAQFDGVGRVKRGAFMRSIADHMESDRDRLVSRAMRETALAEARLQGEVARTCWQLRFYAEIAEDGSYLDVRIDRAEPDRRPVPKADLRSMLRPLGPVAVFGASNFPFAYSVAGGDTASAFAAGCPVIVKAHPAHPGTSELVGRIIADEAQNHELPEGTFSLLFDSGIEIGKALVRHSSIRAVGFTGSKAGGLALVDLANAREVPIPVFAEMGSVNPVVVLPGRLASDAVGFAKGLHASATMSVGQFCTNPGVVFVVGESGRKEFEKAYSGLMMETAACPMLTPGIEQAYVSRAAEWQDHRAVETLVAPQAPGAPGVFAVSVGSFLDNRLLREELFGPATLLVRCETVSEVMRCLCAMGGQLAASIFASEGDEKDACVVFGAMERLAGRVIFNQFPTGVEVCQAMVHGGPFPATSDGRTTSVGGRAISRWMRPVCYQNVPQDLLPEELRGGIQ